MGARTVKWILFSFIAGYVVVSCSCMHNQKIRIAADIPPDYKITTKIEYVGEF